MVFIWVTQVKRKVISSGLFWMCGCTYTKCDENRKKYPSFGYKIKPYVLNRGNINIMTLYTPLETIFIVFFCILSPVACTLNWSTVWLFFLADSEVWGIARNHTETCQKSMKPVESKRIRFWRETSGRTMKNEQLRFHSKGPNFDACL